MKLKFYINKGVDIVLLGNLEEGRNKCIIISSNSRTEKSYPISTLGSGWNYTFFDEIDFNVVIGSKDVPEYIKDKLRKIINTL